MNLLGDISLMERLLDAKWLRNQVLANNIANADTPGFKRSDVYFEEYLRQAIKDKTDGRNLDLKTTDPRHIAKINSLDNLEPEVIRQDETTFRNDQNNVDIEKEMVELTKNALSYNLLADQIQRKLKLMQTAINEGRK
jgi:flagellar basal-body rod protein FlgB